MTFAWPIAALLGIVVALHGAQRQPVLRPLFHWLPVPLWCYLIPVSAVAVGWLPAGHPAYRALTDRLLPFALALLLLGVDLHAVLQAGRQAVIAMSAGALGIVLGAPLSVWALQRLLPAQAWKGAGTLAGTWTGGTMNLLALRSILQTPEGIFAPLVIVDAVIAYAWMALLVAASAVQPSINGWLHAAAPAARQQPQAPGRSSITRRAEVACAVLAGGLAVLAQRAAMRLPASQLISSSSGWTILLVTTAALSLSLIPWIRRAGEAGARLGTSCLYAVLAATGAQASLRALWAAPVWIAVGLGAVLCHGVLLLLTGRCCRIPLGVLATASQANIGGVVSAPLVGAVYGRWLAPVGLLLAVAGNAVGTYLGVLAASVSRLLIGSP